MGSHLLFLRTHFYVGPLIKIASRNIYRDRECRGRIVDVPTPVSIFCLEVQAQ